MKKIVFFCFLSFYLVNSIQAQQKVKWVLKPIKYDVDRIRINQEHFGKDELFVVTKGKLSGIVNTKGKLVMPIKYTHPDIWCKTKYVSGVIGEKQYFFTRKGKKTTYEVIEAHCSNKHHESALSKKVRKRNQKRPGAFSLNPKNLKVVVYGDNGEPIDTVKFVNGDYFDGKNIYAGRDAFYLLSQNKKYAYKDVGRFVKANDYFIVVSKKKGQFSLYDSEMNLLLPKLRDYQLSDKHKLAVVYFSDSDVGKIVDVDLNVLREGAIGYVDFREDSTAYYKLEDHYELLDIMTGERITIPYKRTYDVRYTDVVITRGDSLRGVFDLEHRKEILPPSHKYLRVQGRYIIGSEQRKGIRTFYIYNRKGRKLLEVKGQKVETSLEYLLVTDKTTSIINEEGEIIQDDVAVSVVNHGFLRISGEGFKTYFVPAVDFYAGNSPVHHYDRIERYTVASKSGQSYVVAKKGKHKGLIRKTGEVVYPFVFDDIYSGIVSKEQVAVRYKGRMGIVVVPDLPAKK